MSVIQNKGVSLFDMMEQKDSTGNPTIRESFASFGGVAAGSKTVNDNSPSLRNCSVDVRASGNDLVQY